MHWEVFRGCPWERLSALGNGLGNAPGMANGAGALLGEWPWGGQVHWELEWEAWGVALGWPSAFENLSGSARGVGNLCWEIVWEMPLGWPVALGSCTGP